MAIRHMPIICLISIVCGLATWKTALGQGIAQRSILRIQGADQKEPIKVNDHIYQAVGFGNTFLVTTDEGNVIIDTSSGMFARRHQEMLRAISKAPVKYIILTHAHPDHVGGVSRWRESGTEVIAQENNRRLRDYQRRLEGIFARRNAAQYGLPEFVVRAAGRDYLSSAFDPTITFSKTYEFKLGGLTFQLFHAPGETQDQLNVWIPELKAAFVGDNIYETFPNMYTLRGTEFRSPVDWIASLDRVISWEPEVMLASHMLPLEGREKIKESLTKYRDAIAFVHDATVKGMNEGKSVDQLMQEIELPEHLRIGEEYGRVSWSVRGIFDGYVGWFDERPLSMYRARSSDVHSDLIELAGGTQPFIQKARQHVDQGQWPEALELLEIVIEGNAESAEALELRIEVYRRLLEKATNVIEQGWLENGIRQDEAALKELRRSS